jgi:hypothetical protein
MPEPSYVTCSICSTASHAATDAGECLAGIDPELPGLLATEEL